jgi:hypothetical protein
VGISIHGTRKYRRSTKYTGVKERVMDNLTLHAALMSLAQEATRLKDEAWNQTVFQEIESALESTDDAVVSLHSLIRSPYRTNE